MKLKSKKEIKNICKKAKDKNQRTVLITGCFDLLHYQHVEHIKKAKKYGEVLLIGLESDENIKLKKGVKRPIFAFKNRAKVLSSLSDVDYVFKIDGCPKKQEERAGFYKSLLEEIKPDILFVNIKSDSHFKDKERLAKKLNIKFVGCITKQNICSSLILKKLLK